MFDPKFHWGITNPPNFADQHSDMVFVSIRNIEDSKMAKTKTFVSYDHSEDAHYKRLLQAWDANPEFDFEFDSRGPNVPINSSDAAVVKAALVRMMKDATHLLVLVGEKSAQSSWMQWEIERAKMDDTKLKLAAVKLGKSNVTPPGLLAVGTSWATSFERDRIVEALRSATNGY
ncbi:TIR domain-containing protein [Mesorhizobium sp. M0088]|uniref:TIR domain-containing protein n=1 Tax=Mesorhizobium sp. M0088 TaxID=2956873 RepID=UPI0033358532